MSVIFISLTLGILAFSVAILLTHRSVRFDQTVFLASFFGLYGLIKLDELFLSSVGYERFPHLLGLAFGLKVCLAPMIYVYTRSLTSPSPVWLSARDWPSLLAPAAALLVAWPFYGLPAADKLALMSPDTRNPDQYEAALMGCQIGFGLFLLTSVIYLAAAGRLFRRHTERLRDLFSRIDDKTYNWLRWTILILAAGWAFHALSEVWAIEGSRPPQVAVAVQFAELGWVSLLAFFGLKQHLIPALVPPMETPVAQTQGRTDPAPLLEAGDLARIANRLDGLMTRQALFTDPELSLRDLSDAVGVRENLLSETFRANFGCNFFEYVNRHRVTRARELLANTDKSILVIGFEAGFNSRSTFNSAFKKVTGLTPSAYREHSARPVHGEETTSANAPGVSLN